MKRVATHDRARTAAMMQCLLVMGPAGMARRAEEIAALPAVMWKGSQLRTVTCRGDYGKGNHAVNLPEQVLWALLHIDSYRCPYHLK